MVRRIICALGLAFILIVVIAVPSSADWREMVEVISERGEGLRTTIEKLKSRAAEGDISSQYMLGSIYYVALTEEPDQDLSLLGNPTLEMAFELFLPPARSGNFYAQYTIGGMYNNGVGVERDHDRAMYWLRKSADQGYSRAFTAIGGMYALGRGVAKDLAEAARWYLRVANAGYISGQYMLGSMLKQGLGVDRDLVLAHRWLRLAAAGGDDKARQALRDLQEIITPEQIAQAERDGEAWLEERGDKAKQKFAAFHDLEKLLKAPEAPE